MRRHDALADSLNELGATFKEIAGIRVVDHFGDPFAEFEAMKELAVADRSERDTVVCMGEDVVQLMQGLVTNNVFELADSGVGQRNLAVSINGRTVMDMRLLHVNDLILMDLEPGTIADGRLGHFKKNVINEDAKFLDRSSGLAKFAIFGQRAADLLTTLIDVDTSPTQLAIFHGTAGTTNDGDEVVVQRLDFGKIPAFEVMIQSDSAARFWKRAIEREAKPVGEHAQEIARVTEQVPRFSIDREQALYGAELGDDIIPLEADLEPLIDFNKGCYLGQEIIARLDSRGTPAKKLRWFTTEKPKEEITVDGKKVGTIVTTVPTPNGVVHAVYLKRDYVEIDL